MFLLCFLFLGLLVTVGEPTMAWSQTPYGVPVERPTGVQAEPHLSPSATQREVPVAPRGSAGGSFVHITPSITVSERYDSNILFLPNKVQDYVTSISPGALAEYKNDLIDSSFMVGISSELYARNPGLNYVGANASFYSNLDNVAGRLIRGWTLRLSDSVMYTPQMPAFAAPQGGNTVPADFVRGIQAYRNNMLTNSVSVQTGYDLAPTVSLTALYTHSMLRFLTDSNAVGTASLFNSTSQSLTVGPMYHLSATNTVSLSYQYQRMEIGSQTGAQATASTGFSTTIQGAFATWRSNLSRMLVVEIAPGFSVVEGSRDPSWTARAQVLWNAQPTTVSLSYSRGLYPSFFISAGVFVSDLISASFTHALTDKWSMSGQYGYSINQLITGSSGAGAGALSSTAHSVGFSATYRFSSSISAIGSVSHNEFSYQPAGDEMMTVARDIVMLQFRAEWR